MTVENIKPGQRLANLRKKLGYTQIEFAKILQINRSTLADYETSRIKLNETILVKLAEEFNISADEILGIKHNTETENEYRLRLMKRLNKIQDLSEARQKTILSSLDMMLNSAKK